MSPIGQVCLISAFMSLSLTMVQARISNWRVEFVKCNYLNYELNASRAVQFCGQTAQFFCCQQEDSLATNKCCTLDELLAELSTQFYLIKILTGLALFLLCLIVLSCVYILIKAKKLLKHVLPFSDQ